MTEIHSFYSELTCPFLEHTLSYSKLTVSMREMCEGPLTYCECFKVLLVAIKLLETMGSL